MSEKKSAHKTVFERNFLQTVFTNFHFITEYFQYIYLFMVIPTYLCHFLFEGK